MASSFPLACADFTFPLLSHEDVLSLVGMLQFDGIDIGLFEGRSHLWPSKEFAGGAEKSGRALRQKAGNVGLSVADVFLQMAPDFAPYAINHPEPARRQQARDWFMQTMDYAAGAGCEHVTTIPGVSFDDGAASLERSIEDLNWRVERAREREIIFGIEAHVGSIVPTPEAARDLIARVPGLTLTLDYTHFIRNGLTDSAVESLIPLAAHVHVRGACAGRLQCGFTQNSIDYARIMRLLRECEYHGWLGLEYVWIDWEHCNECDNLSETIQMRDFLRNQSK